MPPILRSALRSAYDARSLALSLLLVTAATGLEACGKKQPAEVEVEVRSIGLDSASRSPVVVLQDHDRRAALPIWIGPAEAQSIAMQMEGVNAPRPMTHDLMKNILDGAGVAFERVLIKELKGSTYYAVIYLHAGSHELEIDSRPSDAIAMAVRYKRPIFVATALMQGETSIDLLREAPAASTATLSGVTVQNLSDELAEYFSLPPGRGVLVADVEAEGASSLKRGDVILEVDGEAITGVGDFETKVHARTSAAQLSVQRSGERLQIEWGRNRP